MPTDWLYNEVQPHCSEAAAHRSQRFTLARAEAFEAIRQRRQLQQAAAACHVQLLQLWWQWWQLFDVRAADGKASQVPTRQQWNEETTKHVDSIRVFLVCGAATSLAADSVQIP